MPTEIAIISGKGGTGKTSVCASFAAIARDLVLADCDVDAPDLHILLKPDIKKEEDFISSKVAVLDPELCTLCGLCEENCRFDAVTPPKVSYIGCEGCGVCAFVCPENAIEMKDRVSGKVFESTTEYGPMSHATLHAGEGNSGKLVTEVRERAKTMSEESGRNRILIDGSPGIGCPVIATVTGIQLGVVVTEPTVSGIHDMSRVVELLDKFQVPVLIIVNKYDINLEKTQEIEKFCKDNGAELIGKIPYDEILSEALVDTKSLPEYAPAHELTVLLKEIWAKIENRLAG